jgi:hypothetical protein
MPKMSLWVSAISEYISDHHPEWVVNSTLSTYSVAWVVNRSIGISITVSSELHMMACYPSRDLGVITAKFDDTCLFDVLSSTINRLTA